MAKKSGLATSGDIRRKINKGVGAMKHMFRGVKGPAGAKSIHTPKFKAR